MQLGLRTVSLVLVLSSATAVPALGQQTSEELRVDALFSSTIRPDSPGCAVGISESGKQVFARGYGMADLAEPRPIVATTIFDVASVSKQFAAFSAILLAERGRLSLDDDVRRHVPELRDYGERITLANLINHSSGLPDYLTISNSIGRPFSEALDQARAFAIVRSIDRLDFAPGSGFGYSNSNYLLLTLAVERAAGRNLGEFLQTEVFDALGMSATRYAPDDRVPMGNRAVGYVQAGTAFRVGTGTGSDYGSRGLQSSVGDLLVWAHALESGRFGQATYKNMTSPRQLSNGERLRYAGGLIVEDWRGRPIVRHGGNDPRGYTAELLRLPRDRIAIAVLCNRGGISADQLAERTAIAWLADKLPKETAPSAPSAALRSAVGRYLSEDGRAFELRLEGDQVFAPPLANAPMRVLDERTLGFGTYLNNSRLVLGAEPGTMTVVSMGQAPLVYRLYNSVTLNASEAAEYSGHYVNAAHGGHIQISAAEGRLVMTDHLAVPRTLTATSKDRFIIGGGTGFKFERDPEGRIERLIIAQGRVKQLVFRRVRL